MMDKKLTLKLDAAVIERAKAYSKNNGTSLSRLIQGYLDRLTKIKPYDDNEIKVNTVAELSSWIEKNVKPTNAVHMHYKEQKYKALKKKHGL